MNKRPPHGGKPPNRKRRRPKKRNPRESQLIIHDIDEAFRRIWQARKPTKKR